MKTVFEKGRHSAGKKSLEWVRVRNGSPQGFEFVLPLIGGNVSQQVIAFRWLVRQGYNLFSLKVPVASYRESSTVRNADFFRYAR